MSLASAQRALASKNRELLQDTASAKIGASLMEGVGEGIAAIGGFVGEKFNVAENKEAWENVEAGAKELGISKVDIQKPSLRQKWFKKPTDVLGDAGKTYQVGDDRQITLGNLQHYGALAKSDSRSLYEHLAGGKDKFTEAYTTKMKTNLELQGMDASSAYKDQTSREKNPYMGNIDMSYKDQVKFGKDLGLNMVSGTSDTNRAWNRAIDEDSMKPTEVGKSKFPDAYKRAPDPKKETKMPLPSSSPSTDPSSYVGKMDLKSVQSSINEAKDKIGGGFSDWGKNYYQLMSEGTSQEMGQSYFDALVNRRDTLKGMGDKELGS
tara:strand:+ start:187 stop:1152 length:966 start_codon:yes stop_codon:yes gene_type:complete